MLTKAEQLLMADAPTTAPAPRSVAHCGHTYVHDSATWICTLMHGHLGPHIAHGIHAIPFRVWVREQEV